MMKQLFFTCAIFLVQYSYAQRVINVDNADKTITSAFNYSINGAVFSPVKYIRVVEGSPYFKDNWMAGEVFFDNGTGYSNLVLKLDLLAQEIHYLSENNEDMIVNTELKEIKLSDTVSKKSWRFVLGKFISNASPVVSHAWYEVLGTGTYSLYRLYNKSINETTPYGSATTEQRIITKPIYLLSTNSGFYAIKNWKVFSQQLIKDDARAAQFIKEHKLDGGKEEDFILLIDHLNNR